MWSLWVVRTGCDGDCVDDVKQRQADAVLRCALRIVAVQFNIYSAKAADDASRQRYDGERIAGHKPDMNPPLDAID